MFEVSGKIKVVFDTQTFPSGFMKREFVVTTGSDKYPQDLKFEIVKDKCAILDQFTTGQDVSVSFDVRGNEFNGKYYVSLAAWKIQGGNGNSQPSPASRPAPRNHSVPSERQSKVDDWDTTDEIGF